MPTINHKLTTAEAVKMVKTAPAGTTFAIHVRADAAIEGSDQVYPGCCSSYLNISRKEALRLAGDMLSGAMEARGGRLNIGAHTSDYHSDKGNVTYWIG